MTVLRLVAEFLRAGASFKPYMLVAVGPSPHFIRSLIFCPPLINTNLF
jgi:hypothetical protein